MYFNLAPAIISKYGLSNVKQNKYDFLGQTLKVIKNNLNQGILEPLIQKDSELDKINDFKELSLVVKHLIYGIHDAYAVCHT